MNPGSQQQEWTVITVRLWSREEVTKALAYIRVILRSLRENWLDMQQARLEIQRIDARPGRLDRKGMIHREETCAEADKSQTRLEEALLELLGLDIFCIDPAGGLALIPFRQNDELAWYLFELFCPNGVESWRYHSDPLEARRQLREIEQLFSLAPIQS